MSMILKGIDMPKEVNGTKLTLELYVRSDGVVLDDDFEEVGRAIQIPNSHGRLIDADKYQYPGDLEYEPTILESEEDE